MLSRAPPQKKKLIDTQNNPFSTLSLPNLSAVQYTLKDYLLLAPKTGDTIPPFSALSELTDAPRPPTPTPYVYGSNPGSGRIISAMVPPII